MATEYTVISAMDELSLVPSKALRDAISTKTACKDHFAQVKGHKKAAAVDFLIEHHTAFKTFVADSVKLVNADTSEGQKARENWSTSIKADGQALALAAVALAKANVQVFPMDVSYKTDDGTTATITVTLRSWLDNAAWPKMAKRATNDMIFSMVFGYGPYKESKTQPDGYPPRVVIAARNAAHIAKAIAALADRLGVDPISLVSVDKSGRVKLPFGVMNKEPKSEEEPEEHAFWLKNADGPVAVGPRNPITAALRNSKPPGQPRKGQDTDAGQHDSASLVQSIDSVLRLLPVGNGQSTVALNNTMLTKLAKLQQIIADRLAMEDEGAERKRTA